MHFCRPSHTNRDLITPISVKRIAIPIRLYVILGHFLVLQFPCDIVTHPIDYITAALVITNTQRVSAHLYIYNILRNIRAKRFIELAESDASRID